MIIILILAVIVLITAVFFLKSKKKVKNNSIEDNIEKLKNLSVKELDEILLITGTKLINHKGTVERVGKEQADSICKYEEYGCRNYAEVKRFHDAVRAERDRKKNNH